MKKESKKDEKDIIIEKRNKILCKVGMAFLESKKSLSFKELKKITKLSDYKLSQALKITWSQGIAYPTDQKNKKFGEVRKIKYKETDIRISENNRFKAKYLLAIISFYPGCTLKELMILTELDRKSFDKCLSWLSIFGKIYIDGDSFVFSSKLCR
ncbi:MAG: hypothetical protein ACYDH1_18685 [Anaerolineaceae bacterium]